MPTIFKTISFGDIPAGGFQEKSWTPDTDITINKFLLIERSDKSLSNTKLYIKIADESYTLEWVPGSVIGTNTEYCWKPNLKVSKGATVYFKLENARSDTITVDAVLEITK